MGVGGRKLLQTVSPSLPCLLLFAPLEKKTPSESKSRPFKFQKNMHGQKKVLISVFECAFVGRVESMFLYLWRRPNVPREIGISDTFDLVGTFGIYCLGLDLGVGIVLISCNNNYYVS